VPFELPDLSAQDAQDVQSWFTDTALPHLVSIVGILLVATLLRFILLRLLRRVINRSLDSRLGDRLERNKATRVIGVATGALNERRRQRVETFGSVLGSVITGLVFGIAFLMILADLGFNLAPVLASAGVAGVALGFGAQSLVKDYLSGVFMLLEDQYGVGDLIDTGEAVGTVEEVTLRITKLRDASGVAWYVRNGEIVRVANKSQGWSTAIVDLPVAYTENIERAQQIIRDVVHALYQDEAYADVLLEEPTVVGVEQITGTTVTVRVIGKTQPNQQWGFQRAVRERVKVAFDAAGIRAPVTLPTVPGGPTPGGTISGTV
jgi:small-conductance mechanosensitive channel